jgi:hypothetical protein
MLILYVLKIKIVVVFGKREPKISNYSYNNKSGNPASSVKSGGSGHTGWGTYERGYVYWGCRPNGRAGINCVKKCPNFGG